MPQVPQAKPALQVPRDLQALLERLEQQGRLVRRAKQVLSAHLETWAIRALQVLRE